MVLRRPKVVVDDDDVAFLKFASDLLRPVCAAVFVAQTPLSAVWRLETEAIDVMLCDLRLAMSDGRQLLQSVRAGWPHVARVLVTGYGGDAVKPGTFPAAQAVVFKPVDGDSLVDLVRRLGRVPATRLRDVDVTELARERTGARSIITGDLGWDGDTDPG